MSRGGTLDMVLADETNLDPRQIEAVMDEYRRFPALLAINAVTSQVTVPSPVIDEMWHHHLLGTRAGRWFCDDMIGSLLDR